MAGTISSHLEQEPPAPLRVSSELLRVIAECRDRRASGQDRIAVFKIGLAEGRTHLLQIRKCPAQISLRKLQPEIIIRLQQNIFGHHEPLPHRAVGRLPEVTALRVLLVCAPADQRDLHIRDLRSGQNALMTALPQVGQHETLPVAGERVDAAFAFKHQTAPGFSRFKQQMHLRIVPERLKVADALYGLGNRLFIYDRRPSECNLQVEPLLHNFLQDLPLDLSHHTRGDLPLALVVRDLQHRLLLLENAQILVGLVRVRPLRQQDLPGQDGDDKTGVPGGICAETLPGVGRGQTADRAHTARSCLRQRCEAVTGVEADLRDFFCKCSPALLRFLTARHISAGISSVVSKFLPDGDGSAGDLHPGKALPPVARDLENTRGEFLRVHRSRGVQIQPCEKFADSLHFQRRAEKDREELSLRHQHRNVHRRDRLAIHDTAQQIFITECQILLQVFVFQKIEQLLPNEAFFERVPGGVGGAAVCICEIYIWIWRKLERICMQLLLNFQKDCRLSFLSVAKAFRLVHLIDENDRRHIIMLQQRPQGLHLRVHAIRAAYHQHREIQHLQRALHLRRKIRVSRGIEQRVFTRRDELGLLREDGDPARAFHFIRVKKGVPGVHPPHPADASAQIQQALRERGLAGVYMGADTDYEVICFNHKNSFR